MTINEIVGTLSILLAGGIITLIVRRVMTRNKTVHDDDWPSNWPDDEVTYSMEEVMARMDKTMRIGKKYYSRNHRRGGMFKFEHPISVRRGQKFLGELSPGLPDMINRKIARQKPGKVVEQKPARSSRYRGNRRCRRYFGNNR